MIDRAIATLWAGTACWHSTRPAIHELRIGGVRRWLAADDEPAYRRSVRAHADRGVLVSLAPRIAAESDVHRGSCLWVRVEGRKQVDALRSFAARPTLVLREGSLLRATACWMLGREVDVDVLADLNRRLAHALGAVKKHGRPETFVAAPGALVGKHRVVPVYVTDNLYSAEQFLGLRRPPEPSTAWKEKAA